MSMVEEIKEAILKLPAETRREVTSWCAELVEEEWDTLIEQDIRAGKFNDLANAARKAHKEGRTTEL